MKRQEARIVRVKGTGFLYPLYTAWIEPWCGCPGWYARGLRTGAISQMDAFAQAQSELDNHRYQHEREGK